jgi:hypothetical protein
VNVQTDIPTVSEVVGRAAALVDPAGQDDAVVELLEVYEDDDRAAPGLGDGLAEELRTTAAGLDPEGDSPAVRVAAAVAFFLSTKPQGADDDAATLRVAARVEWGDDPPESVAAWLAARGAGG